MPTETISLTMSNTSEKTSREVLNEVIKVMDEKGYHSKEQIIGYLISGDPSYIPRVGSIRNLIRLVPREQILKDLLEYYLEEDE